MTEAPTHYEWTYEEDGIRYEIFHAKIKTPDCPEDATCYEVRNPETATTTHVCDRAWGEGGPSTMDFRRLLDKAKERQA